MADLMGARVELGTLYACYGGLLTEKQRQAVRLYAGEDQSLSEIAGADGRQPPERARAHYPLRAEAAQMRWSALHLAQQTLSIQAGLEEAVTQLDGGDTAASRAILKQMLAQLDQ